MGLAAFLFKTDEQKRLTELVCVDGLTASVNELALMSGLPYATTWEVMRKMEEEGLVLKKRQGKATLFSSNLEAEHANALKVLMGTSQQGKQPLTDFEAMDLPLVGEVPELHHEKAKTVEELLVKTVFIAKRNSTLLRLLPVLAKRLGTNLDSNLLVYWSKQFHVDRELGFVLALTAELSKERKYAVLARKLKDKRWSKTTTFLEHESKLSGFQARLVDENTPDLAKKWFLKVNMSLDSFKSHYVKFALGES